MTARIEALRSANQHLQDTVKKIEKSPDPSLIIPTLQTLENDRKIIVITQIYHNAFPSETSQLSKEEKQLRAEEEKVLEQANQAFAKVYQWCIARLDSEILRMGQSLTETLSSTDLPQPMMKTLGSIKKYAEIFCTTFGLCSDQVKKVHTMIKLLDCAMNKQIRLMPLEEPAFSPPVARTFPLVPIRREQGLLSLSNELLEFLYGKLKAPHIGALSASCRLFEEELRSHRRGIVTSNKNRTLLENCVAENYKEDHFSVASCARALLKQPNFQIHVPNDRRLACTAPGVFLLFDLEKKMVLNTCIFDTNSTFYQVNDNKLAIATNRNPPQIDLWDLEKGSKLFSLTSPHEAAIDTVRVQGNFLISKSSNEIKIWDIRKQEWIETLKTPCNDFSIIGIVGNRLMGLEDSQDEGLRLREIPLTHIHIGEQVPSSQENEQFMLSGDLLFAKKGSTQIAIFNIRTGNQLGSLQLEAELTHRLIKQSGNNIIVTGTSPFGEAKMQIFDLDSLRNIKTLTLPQTSIHAIDVIDDHLFISTENWGFLSLNYYLRIQKLDSNEPICHLKFTSPFNFFTREGKLLMAEPTGITVRDFHTKTSLLIAIAEEFEKEQPSALDRLKKLNPMVKNGIFSALYEIHRFEQTYWGCGEHAFLGEHGLTCTDKERAAAIYRSILKNISSDLKANQTQKALKHFSELPYEIKNAIYAKLYASMKFKNDYFGCAEHAFLEKYGQTAPNEKRIAVIEEFLAIQQSAFLS